MDELGQSKEMMLLTIKFIEREKKELLDRMSWSTWIVAKIYLGYVRLKRFAGL